MMSRKARTQIKAGEKVAKKNGTPAINKVVGEENPTEDAPTEDTPAEEKPTGLGTGFLSDAVRAIKRRKRERQKQIDELTKD